MTKIATTTPVLFAESAESEQPSQDNREEMNQFTCQQPLVLKDQEEWLYLLQIKDIHKDMLTQHVTAAYSCVSVSPTSMFARRDAGLFCCGVRMVQSCKLDTESSSDS